MANRLDQIVWIIKNVQVLFILKHDSLFPNALKPVFMERPKTFFHQHLLVLNWHE